MLSRRLYNKYIVYLKVLHTIKPQNVLPYYMYHNVHVQVCSDREPYFTFHISSFSWPSHLILTF